MAIKLYTFTNPVPLTDRRSFNADATLLFKHDSPEEIPPNHMRVLRFNGYPSAKKVELVTSVRDVSGISKTIAELQVAAGNSQRGQSGTTSETDRARTTPL